MKQERKCIETVANLIIALLGIAFVALPQGVNAQVKLHASRSPNQPAVQEELPETRPARPLPTMPGESANNDPVKSWTRETEPENYDKQFLDRLVWENHKVGDYTLRTGIIYGKWIAATQFLRNGKAVLTEYTPPSEYVTVIDPVSGLECHGQLARDVNNDGIPEIAFLHRKLYDPQYHMYTVYALRKDAPKLLWKSGGRLGDWLQQSKK